VLALSNEVLRPNNDWSDKARRFIGIRLKAPVIEDLDFRIARMYGLASGRRPQQGLERLALIIDPTGIVRLIIHRPLPNIEDALTEITRELDRLQGYPIAEPSLDNTEVLEQPDRILGEYQPKIAYFPKKKLDLN
jgi:peroxiredoxin (alkyl hydroperoxide reductase subunit C)